MGIRVGQPAPNVAVDYWIRGAHGSKSMSLSDHLGKWIVLFFYPRDFTFICPTEIVAFGDMQADFEKEDAVVIGASTDSFFSHKAWFETAEQLKGFSYAVIADTSQTLSKAFDVLLEDGAALRGTFVIDPDGIVRHMTVNDLDVGRNVEETLRVLQGLRCGQLCPVGWNLGEPTLTTYNEWLGKVFPRLSMTVLADASNRLQTVKFKAGDIIIKQGDEPDRFYIIVDGEVAVVRSTVQGEEVELARLGPGEIFGEMAMLLEARRTADVRAGSDTELLAMDWNDLKTLLDDSDPTARDLMKIVEQRRAQIPD